MPMESEEQYGAEADGSKSADYCSYCYANGAFTADMTMEQMVDFCVPYMKDDFKNPEEAKASLMQFFPKLKRWAVQ